MMHRDHPVWFLFNLIAVAGFITIFSWINASEFDETEAKMIGAVITAWTAWEGVKVYARKKLVDAGKDDTK